MKCANNILFFAYQIKTGVQLKKEEFEFWLLLTGKLDWVMYPSEHKPVTGQMTLDEYWELDMELEKHLEEYTKNKTTQYATNRINSEKH